MQWRLRAGRTPYVATESLLDLTRANRFSSCSVEGPTHTVRLILAIVGGSAAILSALVFVVKRVVTASIDAHFERLKGALDARINLDRDWVQRVDEQALIALPALLSLSYKAKLAAEQLACSRTIIELSNETAVEAARELTATLLSYRIYVEPRAFAALHELKHAVQGLRFFCDRVTRRSNPVELSLEERASLSEVCGRVVTTFAQVDSDLGELFRAPQRRLVR